MIDWSATAAWIALAISIIGSIAGPIITTVLANKHQLKLRKLEISDNQTMTFLNSRKQTIENFMKYVGECIANPEPQTKGQCGRNFFPIYPYVPENLWNSLDVLYEILVDDDFDVGIAQFQFVKITRRLAEILKEQPPIHP